MKKLHLAFQLPFTYSKKILICPFCNFPYLKDKGNYTYSKIDIKPLNVIIKKYHCPKCNKYFRIYPQGIDSSNITVRIEKLLKILYILGVSGELIYKIFTILGIHISKTTIWRKGITLITPSPSPARDVSLSCQRRGQGEEGAKGGFSYKKRDFKIISKSKTNIALICLNEVSLDISIKQNQDIILDIMFHDANIMDILKKYLQKEKIYPPEMK